MSYAALHFHDLPLSCLLARDGTPPDQPAALLSTGEREKSHLVAVNLAARQLGIHPGLRTTRGLARCADLLLLDPDPATEKSAQAETLAFVETLVPDFELTTAETFLLDLSTMLVASVNDWTAQTIDSASYLVLPLQVGLGSTPDLAHLASLCPHQPQPAFPQPYRSRARQNLSASARPRPTTLGAPNSHRSRQAPPSGARRTPRQRARATPRHRPRQAPPSS